MPRFALWTRLQISFLKALRFVYSKVSGRPLLYNIFETTNPHWKKFPDPPTNHRGKVKVPTLGKRYYAGMYPRWIMWNPEEPNNLYININFLVAAYSQLVHKEPDKLTVLLLEELSKVYTKKLLTQSVGEHVQPKAIIHYTDSSNKQENLEINYDFWVSPKLQKKFEEV